MMKRLACAAASAVVLGVGAVASQEMMFGGEEDQAYAADLWQVMVDMQLAGDNAIRSFPMKG